jgi:hypothetical protein
MEPPKAAPDPARLPPDPTPAPAEDEPIEEVLWRFVEENGWLAKPRPPLPPRPPEPKSIHQMTPEEMHESLPVHLRRQRPDGTYYAMGLISRMQQDLEDLTQGKRAATYPEVDEYLGYALLAEGLAPRGLSAPEAVKWWRAGGSEVLSERPTMAAAPASHDRVEGPVSRPDQDTPGGSVIAPEAPAAGSVPPMQIPFIGHPMLAAVNGSVDLATIMEKSSPGETGLVNAKAPATTLGSGKRSPNAVRRPRQQQTAKPVRQGVWYDPRTKRWMAGGIAVWSPDKQAGTADTVRKDLKDPRVKALLDLLGWSEGAKAMWHTSHGSMPPLTDLSEFPYAAKVPVGRYQFEAPTYDEFAKARLGLKDFSPESQDMTAVMMLRELNAVEAIQRNDLAGAIAGLSKRWASVPISSTKDYSAIAVYKNGKKKRNPKTGEIVVQVAKKYNDIVRMYKFFLKCYGISDEDIGRLKY